MKLTKFFFILFLTLSLVACGNETSDSNENKTSNTPEVEDVVDETEEATDDEAEDSEIIIERTPAEEFAHVQEVIRAVERYIEFINDFSDDDAEVGDSGVLELIHAKEEDFSGIATMISHMTFIQVEKYSMTHVEKINDNLYLVRGKQIVREEPIEGEINYVESGLSPYVCEIDGEFKLALAKDRIPESLYDNFDDIPENYDPILRWNQN